MLPKCGGGPCFFKWVPLEADHERVRPDRWPNDPTAAAALVALVIADIHSLEDDGDADALLEDFMRAAWPSARGQRQ